MPLLPPLHHSTAVERLEFARPARALAHAPRRPFAQAAAGLLVAALLSACGSEDPLSTGGHLSPEARQASIDRLVMLSEPLDPTLTSDHHDRRLHQVRAALAELSQAPPEVGRLALETFLEKEKNPDDVPQAVRRHLLMVAARSDPQEATPLLEKMTMEYGHKIEMRTEACLLLGEVAPRRAVELLGPELEKRRATSTMPDDEFLLRAYVEGCRRSGTDPVPVLVDVVTNIFKQDAARHQAAEELGNYPTPLALQALRAILIESTGNSYLRIKAAQSIRKAFPREEACAIFEEVATHEADDNFLEFMADMIQENCE